MKYMKIAATIFPFAVLLSIGLGFLDRETKSLWHLLTAEMGNVVALGLYSLFFTAIGCIAWIPFQAAREKQV